MKILVAGAGIAGMATGLALAAPGRQIRLIDRDPPPPDGDMDAVFSGWDRKGATQLRHSHVFLARLFTLIRDRYPDLLAALMAAGARELRFADTLPPPLRGRYTPRPGDADLSILSCRRSTLEAVMRAYTARQPGISFADGVLVRDLRLARPAQGVPCAHALEVELPGGGRETWEADIIVDASGRRSCFPDWLAREGIRPDREETDAGIVYFTGHYRLRPGQGEPDRAKATHPAAADLGFLKYAVFPADGGNFSVTLAVPEGESELRALLVRPRTFDAVCAALPGVAQWTAPERAEAHGPIHTMGNLQNSWTHWLRGGAPLLLNFFAVGDAAIRTNPLYGRGCAAGFIHAQCLADTLRATDDPLARAKFFAARTEAELRPFFDFLVRQDKAAQPRKGGGRPLARVMRSFAEDALSPGARGDAQVLRSVMRGFHMIDRPADSFKNPGIMGRLLLTWALPKRAKRHLYLGSLGPERKDLMALARAPDSSPPITPG